MVKVGIVGFGFMGRMHYRCWREIEGVEITAICDANPNIFEDTAKAAGNIPGAADDVDLSTVRLYQDFETMLSEQQLSAVSIALPTYLHAGFSIKALEAGVNVLCEKPMALNVAECEKMITAAKRSGKVLQIGHCLRFWPEYVRAREIVAGGEYGTVVAATFQRLGAMPKWASDNWLADERRSGGMVLDLHIHDTDFVQYLFGMPQAVRSFGAKGPDGQLIHIVTQYLYDDRKVITAEGSWAMMPAFGFEMSFNIALERATIVYDCTRTPGFRICPADGGEFSPEVEKGDGYSQEIAYFAGLTAGRKLPRITTLEQSRNSVRIVEAEKESAVKGEVVRLV